VVKVADRSHCDKGLADMNFQLSDWSNDQKTAQGGRALNAEYIIYGQFMKMGTMFYLTATMLDINTAQRLYSSREQFQNQDQIFNNIPSFCKQIVDKIPTPNYFIGRWRSREFVSLSDEYYLRRFSQRAPRPNSIRLECEIEFKSDGTLIIHKFENARVIIGYTLENAAFDSAIDTGTGIYKFDNDGLYVEFTISDSSDSTHIGHNYRGSNRYEFDSFRRNCKVWSVGRDGKAYSTFNCFLDDEKGALYYTYFSKVD
jgi:hypothetical protein